MTYKLHKALVDMFFVQLLILHLLVSGLKTYVQICKKYIDLHIINITLKMWYAYLDEPIVWSLSAFMGLIWNTKFVKFY